MLKTDSLFRSSLRSRIIRFEVNKAELLCTEGVSEVESPGEAADREPKASPN